jgi:hypothetical protein
MNRAHTEMTTCCKRLKDECVDVNTVMIVMTVEMEGGGLRSPSAYRDGLSGLVFVWPVGQVRVGGFDSSSEGLPPAETSAYRDGDRSSFCLRVLRVSSFVDSSTEGLPPLLLARDSDLRNFIAYSNSRMICGNLNTARTPLQRHGGRQTC